MPWSEPLSEQGVLAVVEGVCGPAGFRVERRPGACEGRASVYQATKRGRVQVTRTRRWRAVAYAGTVVIPWEAPRETVTAIAKNLVASLASVLAPLEAGWWEHRGARVAITAVEWEG